MTQRVYITIAAIIATTAPVAWAQQGQGVLMRALDEPISLTIPDMPVTLALEDVAAKTGLSVRLGDEVLALLPHGEETRLRITARKVKLRDVLTAMLDPMCLEWRVDGSQVVVSAADVLRRIGRRPTFTEVDILAKLRAGELVQGSDVAAQMRKLTGMAQLNLQWHVIDPAVQADALAAGEKRLPTTAGAYLDGLCHGRGLTWYVWGSDIMIVTAEMQVRRQLRRNVSVRYVNQPLLWVITDLASKAGVKLKMDPGVMKIVGDETRKQFTLIMADATLDEAFEAISGATGLQFTPEKLALRVGAAEDSLADRGRRRGRQRPAFVVHMPFTAPDGSTYTVLFRPDDLPAEMVEAITREKAATIEKLRRQYAPVPAAKPAPATRPATRPATTTQPAG